MPKHLVIIAHSAVTAVKYGRILQDIFRGTAVVMTYNLQEPLPERINGDVILLSVHSIYPIIEPRLGSYDHILIADLTFTKQAINKLLELPVDTKAMLVNSTMEMAVETINGIRNAGIRHLQLVPVYPGIDEIQTADLAITPGESKLVPNGVNQVIDIGDRVLSAQCITDLAVKLQAPKVLNSSTVRSYFSTLVQNAGGIAEVLQKMQNQAQKLKLVMQIFDGGIISLDHNRQITFINDKAKAILGRGDKQLLGNDLEVLYPDSKLLGLERITGPVLDKIMTLNGQQLDISVHPLVTAGEPLEYLILIRTLPDVERKQYYVRRQLLAKGYIAKHTFQDILTWNGAMEVLKKRAGRMARSDSSIFLYGETGAGKELFAQSIHNASLRKGYPFIAINCGAIPKELLESELFGYTEGAFTGARKGGKAGYFELAHQGTLFLDEIGELDLTLQSRLLRVLQEKEVIRVGGDRIIPVDVRILSASNKRLKELVMKGLFREDLYYRLNVLELDIPPLLERKDDILPLIQYYEKPLGKEHTYSPETVNFLLHYPWHGNVRELMNFVERMSYSEGSEATLESVKSCLDPYMVEEKENVACAVRKLSDLRENEAVLQFLLQHLAQNQQDGIHQGRRSLSLQLANGGVDLTEQEIRRYLSILCARGLARSYPGRRGTEITELGLKFLMENKQMGER